MLLNLKREKSTQHIIVYYTIKKRKEQYRKN